MKSLASLLALLLFALPSRAAYEPGYVTTQTFASGSSATYTTRAGAAWLSVLMVGGGGGGGASGTTSPNGTAGGTTTFNAVNANGGSGGSGTTTTTPGAGGAGGTGGSGSAFLRIPGGDGRTATVGALVTAIGPQGGVSCITGRGIGGLGAVAAATTRAPGGGGGGGECVELIINNPAASYTYTVGTGSAGGVGSGTSPATGGTGTNGYIIVYEFNL